MRQKPFILIMLLIFLQACGASAPAVPTINQVFNPTPIKSATVSPSVSLPTPTAISTPSVNQIYATKLNAEGWKIKAENLKLIGIYQDLTFVQFKQNNREVLRVFDANGQSVSDPQTVYAGLIYLGWQAQGKSLSQEQIAKILALADEFRALRKATGALTQMRQKVDGLLKGVDKLRSFDLPKGGLPLLRNVWDALCWLPANAVAAVCLAEPLVRGVGDRATAVDNSLQPAADNLNAFINYYRQNEPVSLKNQAEQTITALANLNEEFFKLDAEAEDLRVSALNLAGHIRNDKYSGWREAARQLASFAGIPAILESTAKGIEIYQKAVEKRATAVAEVQLILKDTVSGLDEFVVSHLEMWGQTP
jgi:hypothetical protein